MGQVSRVLVYIYMGGMLLFGTANTIVMKLTDETSARGEDFAHPYFQCSVMFLGESLCLIFFGITRFMDKRMKRNSDDKTALVNTESSQETPTVFTKYGKWLIMLPAACDTCGSTLMFIGLVLSAPSIYQMIRGAIIIIVALYSIIFLKRSIYRHQWLGVALTTIGITIIGIAAVAYEAPSAKNPALGIILLIIGQLFAGGLFVLEEKIIGKIVVHPLQVVGIEGVSGVGYYLILLPIFNLIPCSNADLCNGGYIENSIEAFRQLAANWLIPFLLLLTMISIALFNWTGVSTTKYATALARSIVDTSRTVLVWIISLLIGWEDFIWLELIGFLILLAGSLIYNEIIVLPFWGFKEAVIQRQNELKHQPEDKLNSSLGDAKSLEDVGPSANS